MKLSALALLVCALAGVRAPRLAAQESSLPELQKLGALTVEFYDAPVVMIYDGETETGYAPVFVENTGGFGLGETPPALTWNGVGFSSRHTFRSEPDGYGSLSFAGEVAPDAQAVLRLDVTVDLTYCGEQGCAQASSREGHTYRISGSIPLEGIEHTGSAGDPSTTCYYYDDHRTLLPEPRRHGTPAGDSLFLDTAAKVPTRRRVGLPCGEPQCPHGGRWADGHRPC